MGILREVARQHATVTLDSKGTTAEVRGLSLTDIGLLTGKHLKELSQVFEGQIRASSASGARVEAVLQKLLDQQAARASVKLPSETGRTTSSKQQKPSQLPVTDGKKS